MTYKTLSLSKIIFLNKANTHIYTTETILLLLLSHVQLFATPWTSARQTSLYLAISQSLLRLTSIEWVMPSNYFTLCHPLLLLLSIFPSIRIFSHELASHQVAKVLQLQLQH